MGPSPPLLGVLGFNHTEERVPSLLMCRKMLDGLKVIPSAWVEFNVGLGED
jgi:hypothetical protein